MRDLVRVALVVAGCALVATACDSPAPEQSPVARASSDTAAADSAAGAAHREEELVAAAESIVAFLQSRAEFDPRLFADTVTLYIAPEGGGATRSVPGEQLRERAEWRVADSRLTPFEGPAQLTTRPGRHLNCLEYRLSTWYAELARLPHVGTRLEPIGATSCLQTWNLTLVFAAEAPAPRLVAAVYDQWEW